MVRCFVAVVVCSASVSLAGTSWSDARWAVATADETQRTTHFFPAPSDAGDVINAIVSAKAGRSVTRISAGLSGDWATDDAQANDFSARAIPDHSNDHSNVAADRFKIPPVKWIDASTTQDSRDMRAVALPLPPSALMAIPGLLVAWLAKRRYARN